MPIPDRPYLPGTEDEVFHRVVPASPPVISDYFHLGVPDAFIVDVVLYERCRGNAAALAIDLESHWDPEAGLLEHPRLRDLIISVVKDGTGGIPAADRDELTARLTVGLVTWAKRIGKPAADTFGDKVKLPGMPAVGLNVLNEMQEFMATPPEQRPALLASKREAFRERMRAHVAKPSPAANSGLSSLAGRVRTPKPEFDPATARVEPNNDERREFTKTFSTGLDVIREAVRSCYSDDETERSAGLRVLKETARALESLRVDVLAVLDEAPDQAAVLPERRRVVWLAEIVEQTELLAEILDPEVLDDEAYLAFVNRLNGAFAEDLLQDHERFCREGHEEHEAGACYIKDNGFKLMRLVYQRTISADPLLDNALSGLDAVSGIAIDAHDQVVLPFAVVLHSALAPEAESVLQAQIAADKGAGVARLMQQWGEANMQFMRLMDVRPVRDILSEIDEDTQPVLGAVPPDAAAGAALGVKLGVFVPTPSIVRQVLADVKAMIATSTDTELFLPDEWTAPDENGGTE